MSSTTATAPATGAIAYHWLITLESHRRSATHSGTITAQRGASRRDLFDAILARVSRNRGDATVVFFALEPDQLA
ncbi:MULTISPECIES: hypothetical protein [Streptomyces]|uniref:Uncharacterized protein n=1 Tax=Streptomyces griseocarneus TaxID=51201 RepID=A0ABX7RS66_9ACTN|nr:MULTISPECIES: hypothetical protein [Streptomyces]QSY50193.1 hypothetical protein J3S04_03825 [Streptomyces griseocarneus]